MGIKYPTTKYSNVDITRQEFEFVLRRMRVTEEQAAVKAAALVLFKGRSQDEAWREAGSSRSNVNSTLKRIVAIHTEALAAYASRFAQPEPVIEIIDDPMPDVQAALDKRGPVVIGKNWQKEQPKESAPDEPSPLFTSEQKGGECEHGGWTCIVQRRRMHPVTAKLAALLGLVDIGLGSKSHDVRAMYKPGNFLPDYLPTKFDPYNDGDDAAAVATLFDLVIEFYGDVPGEHTIGITGEHGQVRHTQPIEHEYQAPSRSAAFCKCVMKYAELWAEQVHGIRLAEEDKTKVNP